MIIVLIICRLVDFTAPTDNRVKIIESENRQILRPCQRTEKAVENEGQSWCAQNGPQELGEETGGTGNQWEILIHLDYSITEIGLNTEKSPGDLGPQ